MLPVALALIGTHARRRPSAFSAGLARAAWLDRVRVIIIEDAHLPATPTILAATFATVALSVYAHGLTSKPLTNRYAEWYHSHPAAQRPDMESVEPRHHQRWRRGSTAV